MCTSCSPKNDAYIHLNERPSTNDNWKQTRRHKNKRVSVDKVGYRQVGDRQRFNHTKGSVLDYRSHASSKASSPQPDSVGDFHPEQGLKDLVPLEVAVVACLELFANADKRLLECVLAARVQHLLFNGCILRTPATQNKNQSSLVSNRGIPLFFFFRSILNIIIIIITMTMFMVQSSCQSLREFTRFIWWMQTECRVAKNPQTKPTD